MDGSTNSEIKPLRYGFSARINPCTSIESHSPKTFMDEMIVFDTSKTSLRLRKSTFLNFYLEFHFLWRFTDLYACNFLSFQLSQSAVAPDHSVRISPNPNAGYLAQSHAGFGAPNFQAPYGSPSHAPFPMFGQPAPMMAPTMPQHISTSPGRAPGVLGTSQNNPANAAALAASLATSNSASASAIPLTERPAEWELQPPPTECVGCNQPFGMFRRLHPCACCNHAFCSACCATKMDVPFHGNTLQGQKVCEGCADHIKRPTKTCLRRIIPYLQPNAPQLSQVLLTLPDLVASEPNFDLLTSIGLPKAVFALLPKLGQSSSVSAVFRLISVLATIGAISPDQPPIDPVLQLLGSVLSGQNPASNNSTRLSAAQCVSALALDPRFVSILSKSAIPPALMSCITNQDEEIKQAGSAALAPLVKDGAVLSTEHTERITSSLVSVSEGVLSTDPSRAARSRETLQSMLTILSVVTATRPHQEALYISEGVQVLLQIAQLDQSVPVLGPIFEILTNVAKIPETLLAILHHNGLTILLDLLNTLMPELKKQSSVGKASSDADRQRKKLVKQLLSLLLKACHRSDDNFEDRERIISVVIKPDTLGTLSSLLPSEHIGKIQRVVMDLLLLAIVSDDSRTAAGKANVLENLTQLAVLSLTHGQSSAKESERTLHRLPRLIELISALIRGHESNTASLVDCGVLALLLDTLAPQSTSQLTTQIARMLATVSAFPSSHGYITSSISSITQLVTSQSPEIVENGLTILANLSAVPESRAVVFSDATVGMVMPLMSSSNTGVQLQAAKFLSGISQDPRASSDMFSSVLRPLVMQLTSQLVPVRHTAVITLLDLLRSSQPKGGVDSSAGVKTMLAKEDGAVLSIANIMVSCKPPTPNHPEAELKRSCAELLSLLASNPTGRAVISSTPVATQTILQSLFSPDDILVQWSVFTISALLRNQDNQLAEGIRTSGGLLVLSRILDNASTTPQLHHAAISAISMLFGYPSCRQVFLDEGIIRRLLQTVWEATKTLQEGGKQRIEASSRNRVFAAIAALQQLIQAASDVAQGIAKDALSLKNLADSIVSLSPKHGSSTPQGDPELCEQVVYLALLLCSAHADAWATLVRAGGLNLLLALASSNNLSAKRSALNELARLSLDISFRKIIFDGDGLATALHIVESIRDLHSIFGNSITETTGGAQGSPSAAISSSSSSYLSLHVLEKSLEVITNVCEDAPALASLLQQDGAARLSHLLSRFLEASPDTFQSKVVISIAYNLVRILLQMLMSQKPPAPSALLPALPWLLRLVSIDISQASYQALQLTKIVCDTLVKLMDDQNTLQTLRSLRAQQIFLNLLVRYRPSLQSPNIAEIAIIALNKIVGDSESSISDLGLVIPPEDMESLFGYLKFPIVLQVVFALASDKRSAFRTSLDKTAISKLLPHLHTLLTSPSDSKSSSTDPVALVTAIFQPRAGVPPSFGLLEDSALIHLVHSLVGYLDPRSKSKRIGTGIEHSNGASGASDSLLDGKILLSGLSLLRYMSLRPCIHRPALIQDHSEEKKVAESSSNSLESSLEKLRVSALLKADAEQFPISEPPRLAILQLVFTLVSLYFPDVPLNVSEVSPTNTTLVSEESAKPTELSKEESSSHLETSNKNIGMDEMQKHNYAPIEILQLTELLLALLSSLSKSASMHSIIAQSGVLDLSHQSLRHFLEMQESSAGISSDLSLATKQEVVARQVPLALSIIENMTIGDCTVGVPLTGTLFEVLALGVPRAMMVAILELLRQLTTREETVAQIIAVDGIMSLIGLLSNDNNHVTSLSLSILCNLAKFDDIQASLSRYIDSSLLQELSDRLSDSELAFNLAKLKSHLGIVD